ncbi:aconitase X [Desulfosarcina sp.]|uniref:aconitase X n=1 Tax=Desulfosarcina sp. TaxID=2027861 RepID=UPI003970BDDC
MKLSDKEKMILDGQKGLVKQKAMELIVRYCRVVGAETLCKVTWADLFCGSHHYLDVVPSDDFDVIFSKMSLCSSEIVNLEKMDAQCICFSGVDADCSEVSDGMLMSPEKKARNARFLSRFVDAGVVLSGNCIPYLTGFIPLMGEHFVSCESSAVLFMNSAWGACGNGDGIEASFCAAVCGRTPLAGKHLPENRIGTDLVVVDIEPRSVHDWDLLGYTLGRQLPPHSIPVLTGDYPRPTSIQLKAFFASLACAAGTELCHIVGLTPEAGTHGQALNHRKPNLTIEIGAVDMTASLQELSGHGREKIDYVSLGCPHYHIDELRRIAAYLDGKRIHPDTTVHLWTAGTIKHMADRCGYTETIEDAGARLLTGSCPSTRGYPDGVRSAAYDSAKQRISAAQETDAKLFYGSWKACLQSAISGYWEGR